MSAPAVRDILAESAVDYGSFHSEVDNFNRDYESLGEINNAARSLGTRNAESMAAGWLSYAALIASETPSFESGVREMQSHYGNSGIMTGLQNDMRWVLQFEGSDEALDRALKVSRSDARRLKRIGDKISRQTSTLQTIGWAKAKLGDNTRFLKELELAGVSSHANSGSVRSLFDGSNIDSVISRASGLGASGSLWDNISGTSVANDFRLPVLTSSGFSTFQVASRRDRSDEFVNLRIATLAAYRIIGETSVNTPALRQALTESASSNGMTSCLSSAQLQFENCVYANHLVFERPKCIGVHAVGDVGSCIEKFSD